MSRHFAARGVAMALAAVCGSAIASLEAGGDSDAPGIARALAEASDADVDAHDFRWGPSRGALSDFLGGRDVWFVARPRSEATHDVFRARVRVTPEGRIVDVRTVKNITTTELGDEHALVMKGERAAFATRAFGQEQSVTLLFTDGEGAQNLATSPFDVLTAWVTNWQNTSDGRGVGRVDYTWEAPVKNVGLELEGSEDAPALSVSLATDAGENVSASVDPRDGSVRVQPKDAPAVQLAAQVGRHLPKRFIFWAVDTVRAVTGPAPIAWLEERTFALRDMMRRASKSDGSGTAFDDVAGTGDGTGAASTTGSALVTRGESDDTWPPKSLKPVLPNPEAGEGAWSAIDLPWLKRLKGKAPPAFFRTFIRADEQRPYTRVLFVAMDMRQLTLDMEAGVEDPKPLTGPPGSGRLPRKPEVLDNVVAAFNGGFKTEHGSYGMMVHKRVLLPPQPGAATVMVLSDNRVAMGTWGASREIGGMRDIDKNDIVSFRQNLDPLLDGDKVNPSDRGQWGFTLPGTGVQTERSGLCVTPAGYLIYAWGDDTSATALGKAMKAAGCNYGMHLDMNPHHTGLSFIDIVDVTRKQYRAELLTRKMEIAPDRFIEYAPKDFFYVMLRKVDLPDVNGHAFRGDDGKEPAPAFLPAVTKSDVDGVNLVRADVSRVHFRLVAGTREPRLRGSGPAPELDKSEADDALFAVAAGFATDKKMRGLTVNGRHWGAFGNVQGWASLEVDGDGALSMVTGRAEALAGDAIELPVLFDARGDGSSDELAELTRNPVADAPWAVGFAEGALYVAHGKTPAAEARALKSVGVTQAVLLVRSGAGDHFFHRAGTNDALHAQYAESALYAIGQKARPRAFRVEPEDAVTPKKR